MIRYFQNTREITYMLIYLMALDTEEERIKFVRLYEDYRNRMHYTASILLKSEIEAEDIVHDTFLTLTDYLDRIDEKDSVGTWNYIVTILKNKCYNFLKRNKRIELTEDEEVFEQPVEMYNLLENQLIKEEAEEFLNTLIKGLKYPYREVIYAILEKERDDNCILNCLYGKYSFGERAVLDEILNYIKNTDYHIRCSVLSIIELILEEESCTKECKRKIKITLTELLKREKANAVKEQAEEIMRWL